MPPPAPDGGFAFTGRLPDRQARLYLGAAGAVWAGAVLGMRFGWRPLAAAAAAAGLAALGRRWTAALIIGLGSAGLAAGLLADARQEQAAAAVLPAGEVRLLVEALADGGGGADRGWALVRAAAVKRAGEEGGGRPWDGPPGWLRGDVSGWPRSSRWWVTTVMTPLPEDQRSGGPGRRAVWEGKAEEADFAGYGGGLPGGQAAGVRSLILERLRPETDRGRALLAGFLLGDVSRLGDMEVEHMRRAGLSHFVAVSGSNVALFLGALFLLSGPLGWSARRRAVLGLAGLGFFVLLIGPDPSVMRAAVMAGLVLSGRAFGLRPDIWRVLAAGVVLLILASPELAFSLGFQLSVAATAGVIVGSGCFRGVRPRWLGTALGASTFAQLSVAPVLLLAIGTIPLWAPAANVAAGPLVLAATGLGAAGVLTGLDPVTAIGAAAARAVLVIAEAAAGLPQIDWRAFLLLLLIGAAALRRCLRPAALLASAAAVAALTVSFSPGLFGGPPVRPAFVALDVGQGDALLLLGEGGETLLVDGGSDGLVLRDGLARFGVRYIDLLIVSHAHRDHYGGLAGLIGSVPIREMWYAPFPGQGEQFGEFIASARARTAVSTPRPGRYRVGGVGLEVLGPLRRYASLNDQSIVAVASLGGSRILLSGDIERIAQAEMDPPPVEILKVPHQGAATSDPAWLAGTGASAAVVSVGPNTYGHPSDDLLDGLAAAGMEVRRTDIEGDVVIRLPLPAPVQGRALPSPQAARGAPRAGRAG